MTLQNFFGVPSETLLSYDLNGWNIFVDDLQSYRVEVIDPTSAHNLADFEDIRVFIEQTYNKYEHSNEHMWYCVDVFQRLYATNSYNSFTPIMMLDERNNNIPIVTLTDILRNTREVVDVVKQMRDKKIRPYCIFSWAVLLLSDIGIGHDINSTKVICHQLKQDTDDKHYIPFVCEMVKTELTKLISHQQQQEQQQLKFSDVAVLYDELLTQYTLRCIETEIMLPQNFSVQTQSIAEKLTNNDRNNVVVDMFENISSFESPIVIAVAQSGVNWFFSYDICSRARTKLVIIDPVTCHEESYSDCMDVITWAPNYDGTFRKL